MRKLVIVLLLALQQFSLNPALAQDVPAVTIVETFYSALKAGDTETVRALIGEPLSSQYHVLLTQNSDYPDFLRRHYNGSSGKVVATNPVGSGEATVEFDITFQDGSHSVLRFHVQAQQDASWKIVEQDAMN